LKNRIHHVVNYTCWEFNLFTFLTNRTDGYEDCAANAIMISLHSWQSSNDGSMPIANELFPNLVLHK